MGAGTSIVSLDSKPIGTSTPYRGVHYSSVLLNRGLRLAATKRVQTPFLAATAIKPLDLWNKFRARSAYLLYSNDRQWGFGFSLIFRSMSITCPHKLVGSLWQTQSQSCREVLTLPLYPR